MSTEQYGPRRRGAEASDGQQPLTIAERKALAARETSSDDRDSPLWMTENETEPEVEDSTVEEPALGASVDHDDEEEDGAGVKRRSKKALFIVAGGVLAAVILGCAVIIPKVTHANTVAEYRQAVAELQMLNDERSQREIDEKSIAVLASLQAPEASELRTQILNVAADGRLVSADQAQALREVAEQISEAAQRAGTDVPKGVNRKAPDGGWLSVTDPDFGEALKPEPSEKIKTKDESHVTSNDVAQTQAKAKRIKDNDRGAKLQSPFTKPLNSALKVLEDVASSSDSSAAKAALTVEGSVAERISALSLALVEHGKDLTRKEDDAKSEEPSAEGNTAPQESSYASTPQSDQPQEPTYVEREVVIPPEEVPGDYKQWDGEGKWNPEYHPPAQQPELVDPGQE